jgi:molybdate transport system substrate-binding protein
MESRASAYSGSWGATRAGHNRGCRDATGRASRTSAFTNRAALVALCSLVLIGGPAWAGPAKSTLRVFAAASLGNAFGEIARQFESAHPGFAVQLNLAGSHQLATELEHGAACDVFASADRRWMDHVQSLSLLAGDPAEFARNQLIVIVPRTNPARIGRLHDLTKRGVKLVIGAPAVPVGAYSRDALEKLGRTPGFPPDFARRVLANVVSEEENVTSVVGKVQLGEADAGIVYRSDVTRAVARFVRVFEIPDSANVIASYPIAVIKNAREEVAGRDFVALVLSPEGQRILQRHGLIPVVGAP